MKKKSELFEITAEEFFEALPVGECARIDVKDSDGTEMTADICRTGKNRIEYEAATIDKKKGNVELQFGKWERKPKGGK